MRGRDSTGTDLLDGILCVKDGGEMGGDMCGEVYLHACTLIIEVYYDTGWVSDGVHKMSGDHFAQMNWATRLISVQQRR